MSNDPAASADWTAVLARSQAFLAMYQAGLDDSTMVERAKFLMKLGLPRADAAALLGTSDESLRVQLGQAARKAGKKKPAKKAAPK